MAENSTPVRARIALLHIVDTSRLLDVLKGEKKAIFTAASLASAIVDYLHGLQPRPDPDPHDGAPPDRPAGNGQAATSSTAEGPQ